MQLSRRLKIAFDIGGVITKFPEICYTLISSLKSHFDIYIVTDIPRETAVKLCEKNGLFKLIPSENLVSADWNQFGDRCKSMVYKDLGIDVAIDDRPDYIYEGVTLGLYTMPRPDLPYYDKSWIN